MSAAVDHSISQALTGLLHYIIGEEDEEEEEGEAEKKGGTARKTLSTQ